MIRRFIPKQTLLIRLEDAKTPEKKWVNVALEGRYLGYFGGERPFEFTPETFDQIVANFRANPAYEAGADNVGTTKVIAWDFAHASEMAPTQGNLAVDGAPAQGWIFELERRDGEKGAELWALSEFLEPAAGYIKDEKYRWASVSVHFNSTHGLTGEPIGAVLSSVALTNGPFIEGLVPMAASRNFWFEPARDAKDALGSFKELFGLPELSDVVAVNAELAKLVQWIETGTTPFGIDVVELIGHMRKILNLPAMDAEVDVLQEATKVVSRLLEEKVIDNGGAPSPVVEPQLSKPNGGQDMEFLAQLAKMLGVKETEKEVLSSIEDAVDLRRSLATICATKGDTNSVLLEATQEGMSTKDRLSTLLKAIGVEDPDAGIAQIADLLTKAEQLTKAMPELEDLREKMGKVEAKEIEDDVAEAIAAHKLPESVKPALLLMRQGQPDNFAKTYPKVDPHKVALTQPLATLDGQTLPVVKPVSTVQTPPPADQIDLGAYPGANTTQRAISCVKATVPNAGGMNWDQLYRAGVSLKKQQNVIDSRAE